MSYDLRDIKKLRIVAVAKKLSMRLGLRGNEIRGECPFQFPSDGTHEPLSLAFDKAVNTFKCASCGNSGSVLDLVCQVTGIGPGEAIRWIGENFCLPGVVVCEEKSASGTEPEQQEKTPDPAAQLPTLSEVYSDFLAILGDPSSDAVAYMHNRRISLGTLEKHGVTDIKGFHGTASVLKDRYPPELLRKAGLLDATGNLWFEDYPLLFPYSREGKICFLQAHCMDSEKRPRYLRPPEAVPFLYNMDVLRTLADEEQVFLVEGIIDCLTLQERGYHAVASPGISTFKPEWVSDFRGLETYIIHNGQDAAERAANALAVVFAKADLHVRSIKLPRGHDLSSFFVEGGTQPELEHLVQMSTRVKTQRPILEPESRSTMAEFLDQLRQHERRTKATGRDFLGLDMGFPILTQLCGGLDPLGTGQICLVTGSPGVGKTTFSLQTAWQILENNEVAVLYVSYNEGKFVLRLKTLCQLGKMDAGSVLRGEIDARTLSSAIEQMSKWGKGFFVVEGGKATTTEVISDYCKRVKSITGEGRMVAVVDYLEAVPPLDQNLCGNARIEACASELRILSHQLGIPIMVVSSSAVDNLLPGGPGVGANQKIEYREDLLIILERDAEMTKQRFPENSGSAVNVHIPKNRDGGFGSVSFDFHCDCHYFGERGKTFSLPGMTPEPLSEEEETEIGVEISDAISSVIKS
jgi:replicative DNA helicase